eukprot:COSAG02_NODE_28232_length_593_cov_1.202429_1_plen_121_part_00
MAARSSTGQWEEYLSRYVRETSDFDGLTGPDGEEKIWVALTTQFRDVPLTARKEVRAMGERIVADFGAAIIDDSEDEEDGISKSMPRSLLSRLSVRSTGNHYRNKRNTVGKNVYGNGGKH